MLLLFVRRVTKRICPFGRLCKSWLHGLVLKTLRKLHIFHLVFFNAMKRLPLNWFLKIPSQPWWMLQPTPQPMSRSVNCR